MNWEDYISKPDVVLNGKDPDGNRLVLLFSEDFEKRMGYPLDITCAKCFRSDFAKFINSNTNIMSKEIGFEVKKKYNGLSHPCSKNILSKVAIQENPDVAIEFYVEHPNGKSLFETVPKNIKTLVTKYTKAKAEDAKKKAEEPKAD